MPRDEEQSRDAIALAKTLTENGTLPSPGASTPADESVDPPSDLDVEGTLRLLDEIWPRDDSQPWRIPQRFGRFSILGELGRGGFGVVFLAEDPLLGRRVALKVPRVEVISGNEGWRRFLREARAASRLDHPNLIPLLEAGAIGFVVYIVSAFVPGPSLEQWLRRNRRGASPRWAARLVAALAHAMEHAHQRGILHRDLKPGNVLLHAPECDGQPPNRQAWEGGAAESWMPRICDFGMAKLHEVDGDETRSRVACGSPPYMAPEQAESRRHDIGPATDVYGLGAILYEMLTGRPPFTGKSDVETLRRVVADEPAAPRSVRPGLPRDLETICLKCLSKRPENRYQTATALAEDLERFLEGRPIQARPLAVWARGWKWARRNPAAAAFATAALVAFLTGIGGLLWHEAVLRGVNEQLRLQARRAEENARDARDQRSLVEERERLVRRQLAVHQVVSAQHAVAAHDFERALRLLAAAEPDPRAPEDRGFAWSYLRCFVEERLEVFNGAREWMSALAVAPDGRTLASGGDSGEILLWDLKSNAAPRLVSGRTRQIKQLVFSPDGQSLAALTLGSEVFLCEVASGRLWGPLARTGSGSICPLMFTSNGKRLAGVNPHGSHAGLPFECWDLAPATGEFPVVAPEDIGSTATELTDPRLQSLAGPMDDDLPSLAASLDELKKSWAERPPRGVAVTRDRSLALVGSGDGSFAVYRGGSATRLMVGRLQVRGTTMILFETNAIDGRLSPSERHRLERLAAQLVPTSSDRRGEPDAILRLAINDSVAFSPDGHRLAHWHDAKDLLEILDLPAARDRATFDMGPLNDLAPMTFTPDGETLVFGATDRRLRLWHLRTPRTPEILSGHAPKEAWSIAFAPDGRTLATGGDDHFIRLWDLATGRETAKLRGHQALVSSLAFTPDGRTLASGSYDRKRPIILWDVATLSRRSVLVGHTDTVRAVAFSPDGRTLASDGTDYTVMLWDTKEGRRTAAISQPRGTNTCLAFSPNGLTVAFGAGVHGITLRDTVKGQSRSIITGTRVSALTFLPDGSHLITGHPDGLIKVWDVAAGRQVQTLPGHANSVLGLAISPDGRSLASAGEDRTVRVWDIVTGQELLCLTDCKARVNAVAFSPDGDTLAAADHTGAVTLWRARAAHR